MSFRCSGAVEVDRGTGRQCRVVLAAARVLLVAAERRSQSEEARLVRHRQRLDLLRPQRLLDLSVGDIHVRRIGAHGDCLGDGGGENKVLNRGRVQLDADALPRHLAEAFHLSAHRVAAGRKEGGVVEAGFIRNDDPFEAGVHVPDGDGHAGKSTAGFVGDFAVDCAGDRLGEEWGDEENEE